MGLLSMLRKLGDRLGIVELSSAQQPSAPVKIQTRTITLSELVMNIQVDEVRDLAEPPAELSVSFEEIFKAAGIQPSATGWTIERLQQFLASDQIRKMGRTEAQHETLRMLREEKIDPADLVKDAVARDQAMDAFEGSISEKRQDWIAGRKQLLETLANQIQTLKGELAAEEKKWTEWRREKRQRETDMAHAVGYLIDRPVISIDE